MITQVLTNNYNRSNILKPAIFLILDKKHTSKMSSYLRQDYNLEKQYLSVEVLKENNKELNKKEFKKGKYNKINFINEGMDMTDKNIDLTDLTNINNINNITDLSELNELNGKSSPLFYYSDYTFYKRASSYDNDNNLILVSFKDVRIYLYILTKQ